jgi:hypothetical protein
VRALALANNPDMLNDPPAIRSSMWFSCCNLIPPLLDLLCPLLYEIPYSTTCVQSILLVPPFSVVVFQHPQCALRGVVRLEGRAVLGPVAKLHR